MAAEKTGRIPFNGLFQKATIAWAIGILLLQFAFVFWGRSLFPVVWWDCSLALLLCFLAWKGRAPRNLVVAFLTVPLALLADPATGCGPIGWTILVPSFFVIRKETSILRLALIGQWTFTLLGMGIFSWLWSTLDVFFEMGDLATGFLFFIAALLIGGPFTTYFVLFGLVRKNLRIPLGLLAPTLYTFAEFWALSPVPQQLALAFTWMPLFIQIADLVGMIGTTFAMVLVGGLLYETLGAWRQNRIGAARNWGLALVLLLAAQIGYGFLKIDQYGPNPESPRSLDVAMIQPVAPLKISNKDTETKLRVADKLIALSSEAVSAPPGLPDLLVWPESAASFSYRSPRFNPEYRKALVEFHRKVPVPMILHDIEFTRSPDDPKIRYYSAITVLSISGEIQGGYRKNILVPFAEYLPGKGWIPGLEKLFTESRSVLPGIEGKAQPAPGGPFAPLICYEILFADHVREVCRSGARYIVNLTNDRWYGQPEQPTQHLSYAVFRAVENRLPIIRCANSGISASIDATGRIRDSDRTGIMEETTMRVRVELREWGSFYASHGDVFGRWALTPVVLILVAYSLFRRRGATKK